MLETIRKVISGWLAVILVVVITVPFALWGIQNYFTTPVEDHIAKVDDTEIAETDFQRRWQSYRSQLQQQFGGTLDPRFFNEAKLKQSVLDSLINSQLLLGAASKNGFEVTQDRISKAITEIPAFQVDGNFNQDVYQQTLSYANLTSDKFKSQLRDEMLAGDFNEVIANSTFITDNEIDAIIKVKDQKRTFSYVLFKQNDYKQDLEISDEEINVYYQEQQTQFTNPEKVAIDYIELSINSIAADIDIDEERIKSQYEAEKNQHTVPEQRLASHILLNLEADADDEKTQAVLKKLDEIKAKLEAGEKFEEIAKQYSEDPGSAIDGGNLDYVEKGDMVPEFEEALFALAEGEISEPVKTEFGWHIIYNRETRTGTTKTYEQLKATITKRLQESEAERLYLEQLDLLDELSYELQDDLQAIADEVGVDIKRTEPFALSDVGVDIATNPKVREAAFSDVLIDGAQVSELIDLGTNRVAIFKVIENIPATVKPLESVKDSIINNLKNEKANDMAKELAESALDKAINEGIEVIVDDESKLKLVENVDRNAPGHPRALLNEVFKLPNMGVENTTKLYQVDAGPGNYAIVELKSISPGDPSELTASQRDAIRTQLANTMKNKERNAIIEYLKSNATIEINQQKLQGDDLES